MPYIIYRSIIFYTMFLALLLQLILWTPISASFCLTPVINTRTWTPLQATGDIYDDNTNSTSTNKQRQQADANSFERLVRSVTRNDEYKFGDLTKKAVTSTTSGVEGAVRTVTRNVEYKFGDITKGVINSTTSGVEDVVKEVTGIDDYRFGDLTRKSFQVADSALSYSEKTLGLMRQRNIHEAVELLNVFWTKSMSPEERREAFTVVVYLGAIAVLSYNFIANAMSALVFAHTWTKVSMEVGASPLTETVWPKFLHAKSIMDYFFGGPCLPARALITVPWFFHYRRFVVAVANKLPSRKKFPVINRYFALILSWMVANIAFVGGVTFLLIQMGSKLTGVPVFVPIVAQ